MTLRTLMRALLLVVLCALAAATPARAGDRELDLLVVDMTPDRIADEITRRCVDRVLRQLRAGYTRVQRLGETATRKHAGRIADPDSFMAWSERDLKPVREREGHFVDTAVLIDCRPDDHMADVLIAPASGGVTRIRLRKVTLDTVTTKWLADIVLHHGWVGFVP